MLGIIQAKRQGSWALTPHICQSLVRGCPMELWACIHIDKVDAGGLRIALQQRCRCWPWKGELEQAKAGGDLRRQALRTGCYRSQRSHSYHVTELGLEPRQPGSRAHTTLWTPHHTVSPTLLVI